MKPITASVTRSEPPPEPVRPRLYAEYVRKLEAEVAAWRAAWTVWNKSGGHTDRPVTMHDCWAEQNDTNAARERLEKARGA